MYPSQPEMHAVGGLESVEVRVNKRRSKKHLGQIRVVVRAKDLVFVVVERVIDAYGVLESVTRQSETEIASLNDGEIARYGRSTDWKWRRIKRRRWISSSVSIAVGRLPVPAHNSRHMPRID